jgi:CRISPR-associated protein Csm4
MKDYRIQIQLTSNLYTPLHGDTLFGMLCWMILYSEGESVLTEFLTKSTANPQLLVSSAFPKDELPMPVIASQYKMDDTKVDTKYIKRLKKQKFISRELFITNRDKFKMEDIQEKLISEMKEVDNLNNQQSIIKAGTGKSSETNKFLAHNSINRLTGMVAEEGGLFFSEIVATPSYKMAEKEENTILDIYISVTSEYDSIIREAFTTLSTYGFGKDSSIGGGQFIFEDKDYKEEKELFANNDKYTYGVTLSPIVPAADDPMDINYQLFTRYGKIGHGSDIGIDPPNTPEADKKRGFFKAPILMFQAGAVVKGASKNYVGYLLDKLHKDERVKHCGYSRLLGLNIV